MIRHFSNIEHEKRLVFQPVNFSGQWKADNGSLMELKVSGNILSGYFKADFHRTGKLEDFPIAGFVNGELISFAVNFGLQGSLSSFAGQYVSMEGLQTIKTVWLLTENVVDSNNGAELVGAVLTGSSDFRRLAV